MCRRVSVVRWTSLCLFLFLLLGASAPVGATRARKHALDNSPFFFDDTDVFRYPGVLVHHTNKLVVEAQSDPVSGSASAIYGGKLAIGVFGNRAATFDDLGQTAGLFELKGLSLPRRIADLMLGLSLGAGQSLGVGVGFAASIEAENNLSGSSRGNRTSGAQAFSLEVLLGYSLRSKALALDIGAEVAFNAFSLVEGDELRAEGSMVPSFAVYSRGFFRLNDTFELAYDITIARRHYSLSTPSNQSSASYGYWLLEAMLGSRVAIRFPQPFAVGASRTNTKAPKSSNKPNVPVMAYFTNGLLLGYQHLGGGNDLNALALGQADVSQSAGAVLFPGVHASLEASIAKMFLVRVGFTARFFFQHASSQLKGLPDPINSEDPSNTTPASLQGTQQVYSWAAGLGFQWAGFRIDGSFEAPLFTQGPNFIGGKAPGLFALVSISYQWK